MSIEKVSQQIREEYEALSGQMQVAARYLMEHPQDVALLSMREQSRCAGVPATTMTRLAKQLGFAGFEELRAVFVGAIRNSSEPFSSRAAELVRTRQSQGGDIAVEMVDRLISSVQHLKSGQQSWALREAAIILQNARTVYAVGQRSAFATAYHFTYLYGYFSTKAALLDGPGGIGADPLTHCGSEDALVVISLDPAARRSVEVAHFARSRGVKIIAITNSPLSTVGRISDVQIVVNYENPAFFDSMTAAFAAVETLVAIVAESEGENVPGAVRLREEQRHALGEWWGDGDTGKTRRPKKSQ